jgi:uncharacterized membrane protein
VGGSAEGASNQPPYVSRRWQTGRTEAFSDGVFAIAITLLVLDLAVPESEFHDLWHGIAHQWPSYLGFATSFLTVGGIWLAHHGIFGRLQYANSRVVQINLLLLMAISFLPFPTRLVAQAIRNENAERAAVIFYGISLFVTSALIGLLWATIVRDRQLLKPEVSDEEIRAITRATTPSPGFFVASIILAIFAPKAAAITYLVAALVLVLRARGDPGSAGTDAVPGDESET